MQIGDIKGENYGGRRSARPLFAGSRLSIPRADRQLTAPSNGGSCKGGRADCAMYTLDAIREQFQAGRFEFSEHAVYQSILRGIGVQEILDAVAGCEIIEDYPEDKVRTELPGTRIRWSGKTPPHSMQLPI